MPSVIKLRVLSHSAASDSLQPFGLEPSPPGSSETYTVEMYVVSNFSLL